MPKVSQRWIYVVALLLAVAIVITALNFDKLTVKDLMTPVLSLFATFFGATFAFRLNEEKERKQLQKVRCESLNRALFVLFRQTNAIVQIYQDFKKHNSPLERGFNLPAIRSPSYDDLKHDFAGLDFLLEFSGAQLLVELSIEQERFHQALVSLTVRNDFYIAEVQPALSKAGLHGKSIKSDLSGLLGIRVCDGAIQGATIAWEHVSACNKTLPSMMKALHCQAKILFPEHKFLSVDAGTGSNFDVEGT